MPARHATAYLGDAGSWRTPNDGSARVIRSRQIDQARHNGVDKIVNRAVRIIADGDLVVVESRGHNTTTEGEAYHNTYCNVLRLEGGKLKEWTEYADSALVNAVLGDPRKVKS